jgi:hypothetical protein
MFYEKTRGVAECSRKKWVDYELFERKSVCILRDKVVSPSNQRPKLG